MKSIEIRSARALVAVAALVVAALAYAEAQGPIAGKAAAQATQERSSAATEVEAAVARTGLAAKLEDALGDAFGGVWFDPAEAQLHIGVTSAAAAREAEAVAERADLGGAVAATPVRSSWAQLGAAQDRWSGRLADLFDRGLVSTALAADRNAVEVKLSSAVASPRVQALEREAAGAAVDVGIEVVPAASLEGVKAARCLKFVTFKAFCDPTILAGVSIDGPKPEEGERATCSAGPAAIVKNPETNAEATETYLLTAGHCIENGGGSAMSWFAYNKKGEKEGEHEIGPAGVYLNSETDVGVIAVEKTYWAKAKDFVPVTAGLVQWSAAAEVEPTAVEKQGKPAKKGKTCFSGERSGKVCGEIKEVGVEVKFEEEEEPTKNLVEVELTGKGGQGDSGGPFYSEANAGTVEGTFVGFKFEDEKKEEGKIVYFQPLETSFEKLAEEKATSLKLLTKDNQRRHGKFKAGKFPVTAHGEGTGVEEFSTELGTLECEGGSYHGVLEEASTTIDVTPAYSECTAFGLEATVEPEGCFYVLHVVEKESPDHYGAEVDIACPEGQSIKVSVPAIGCEFAIEPQEGLESVDLADDTGATPKADITAQPTIAGLTYTVIEEGIACPEGSGEYTSSEPITITGQNPSAPEEKIAIEVADE